MTKEDIDARVDGLVNPPASWRLELWETDPRGIFAVLPLADEVEGRSLYDRWELRACGIRLVLWQGNKIVDSRERSREVS